MTKISLAETLVFKKDQFVVFDSYRNRLIFEDRDYIQFYYKDSEDAMGEPLAIESKDFSGNLLDLQLIETLYPDHKIVVLSINNQDIVTVKIKNDTVFRKEFAYKFHRTKYKTLAEIVNKNKGIKAKYSLFAKTSDLTFENGDTVLFTYRYSAISQVEITKSEQWEGYIEKLELEVEKNDELYESVLYINNKIIAVWETLNEKYLTEWEFK